ncbi:MAG: S-layer protein, partial [Candidatus Aenigmatarchaeota archaeon]
IEVSKKERSRGAICKFYRVKADSFSFSLDESWEKIKLDEVPASDKVRDFFCDFIEDKTFRGSIVVGSPKEHGPFLTSARDGHYAVQLGVFLGDFCDLEKRFIVKLDTEVKAEEAHDRNLVLIGGPIANTVSRDLNEKLDVRFDWEDQWKIVSEKTGREYTGDNIGLIAKVEINGYSRLLLSGLHHKGTKSCIIGLTQYHEQILDDHEPESDFYRVIRGLDKDGDGKTDTIEVLE